eukprot:SM000380S14647  [mRNA]  locus=s380:66879:69443:+ [translate_table: standard]
MAAAGGAAARLLALALLAAALLGGARACFPYGYAGFSYGDCVMSTAVLSSNEVVTNAGGPGIVGYVDLSYGLTKLCWTLVLAANASISVNSNLQIHPGEAYTTGSSLFTVYSTYNGQAIKQPSLNMATTNAAINANGGCYFGNVTMQVVDQIMNGQSAFYIEYYVQSSDQSSLIPSASARGQLVAERKLYVRLESSAVLPSANGTTTNGYVEITFDVGLLCWAISVDSNATLITAAHIHVGGRTVTTATTSLVLFSGTAIMSGCTSARIDQNLYYQMRANPWNYYLDLHGGTATNGMSRGQLDHRVTLTSALTASVTLVLAVGNGGIQYLLQGWDGSLGTPIQAFLSTSSSTSVVRFSFLDLLTGTASTSGWLTIYDNTFLDVLIASPTQYFAYLSVKESPGNLIGGQAVAYQKLTGSTTSPPPPPPPPPP